MSNEFIRILWDSNNELQKSFQDGNRRVNAKIMSVLEYKAPQVEAHMKVNAPWEDQTGNARQGLRAQAFDEGSNKGIVLYGQVDYQIWLELKNNGEYAIINPTIEVMGPEVMRSIERILESI